MADFRDVPDVMTVDEVATKLKVSKNMVYRMINTGEISSFRIGQRQHRILVSTVQSLVTPQVRPTTESENVQAIAATAN